MFAYVLLISRKNEKVKIQTSNIRKFDANRHSPFRKYNISFLLESGETNMETGVILHLADTEEELDRLIKGHRPKYPPAKMLVSCDETTDEEPPLLRKAPLGAKRKVDGHAAEEIALKKRLNNAKKFSFKDLLTKKPQLQDASAREHTPLKNIENERIVLTQKPELQDANTRGRTPLKNIQNERTVLTQDSNIKVKELEDKLEKFQKEFKKISELYKMAKQKLLDLQEEQHNTKILYETLQQDLLIKENEVKNLRSLNEEWQRTGIKTCTETRGYVQRTDTIEDGQFTPVGFIDRNTNKIHLGRDVWLPMEAYTLAVCSVPRRRIQTFPKNILVALCGYRKLGDTSVSGKGSNRNRQSRTPSDKLDPKIALAIKDIYTNWLIHEKGFDRQKAEIEVDGSYKKLIAKKIAQVKQTKCMAYERDKKQVMLGDRASANGEENDEGDQGGHTDEEGNEEIVDLQEVDCESLERAEDKETSNAEYSEDALCKNKEILSNLNGSLQEHESGAFSDDNFEQAEVEETSNAEHFEDRLLKIEETLSNLNGSLEEHESDEFSDDTEN